MGTVRDLGSVVEEEEEDEEVRQVVVQPRAMDTVTEEEEEDEDEAVGNSTIGSVKSTSTSPSVATTPHKRGGSLGNSARRRPQSLVFNHATTGVNGSSMDVVVSPISPESHRPLRTLSLSSTMRGQPPGLRSLALGSPSASPSSPHAHTEVVSPIRERRRHSLFAGPLSGSGSMSGSVARARSGSLSSSSTSRTRSSISYNKSPNSEQPPHHHHQALVSPTGSSISSSMHGSGSVGSGSSATMSVDGTRARAAWRKGLAEASSQWPSMSGMAGYTFPGPAAGGFGALVLEEDAATPEREGEVEVGVGVVEKGVGLAAKVKSLEAQLAQVLEARKGSEESSRVAYDQLRIQVDNLKLRLGDTEEERDMLREDVDGWRARVADVEKALQVERSKVEDEKREVLAARERIRKLGDRLAAASGGGVGETDEAKAMAQAQAKLIGEMRDQIFALAGALERERAEHQTTRDALDRAAMQIEVNAYDEEDPSMPNIDEEDMAMTDTTTSPTDRDRSPMMMKQQREYGSDATFSSSTSFSSHGGANGNEDEGATGVKVPSCAPLFARSPVPKEGESGLGALDTLAEEDEGVEYDEEAAVGRQPVVAGLTAGKPEVPRARVNSGSTGSAVSEGPPKTPSHEHPPANPISNQAAPAAKPSLHHRSESFIRQWSFPRGPVPQVRIAEDDDHCFFFRPNSVEMSLPPLEPAKEALETPPFLMSYLHHEEPETMEILPMTPVSGSHHVRRPSSPRPSFSSSPFTSDFGKASASPAKKRFSGTAPPPSRSAHVSAALSTASSASASSALQALTPRRLSLQNLSNWVGSYVASGPPTAATRMLACGTEDDVMSLAAGMSQDMTPLIRRSGPHASPAMTAPLAPRRFVKPSQQPVPIASSFRNLDFTAAYRMVSEIISV